VGRANLGPATPWCSPRWSTTPTSCRGTSWPPRRASRCAGSRSRRRPARPHRPRPPARRRQAGRLHRHVERARHHHPGRRARRRRPRRRRLVCLDACQYVPHLPTDVAELGADFVAFSATRCSAPPASACCGAGGAARRHAPVPRRRRHDPRRPARRLHPRPAPQVRGRHPAHRRGRRARRRHRLPRRPRHGRVREHEVSSPPTPCAPSPSAFGDTLTIHGPPSRRQRGGVLSLASTTCTPTTSPGARRARRLRAPGPPLRQAAHAVLGVGATARASLYVYNDEDDVDALADALEPTRQTSSPSDPLPSVRPHRPRRPPCPASKTSTARSSSTTTAAPGTAGELPVAARHTHRGVQPAVRRRDRRLPDSTTASS
jgi:hypothetical protein